MSHLHFPGRARGQLNRTTCSTVHCTLGAALLVLATACGDSTAPVAALHPAMGVASGLITVAPAGLATAAGTLRSPMTLEQAMATAQAGATIQLMSGTYQTGDLVVTRPITIRPAPGATVKLTGSVAIAAGEWQAAGSAWRTPWSAQGVPSKAAATPRCPPPISRKSRVDSGPFRTPRTGRWPRRACRRRARPRRPSPRRGPRPLPRRR